MRRSFAAGSEFDEAPLTEERQVVWEDLAQLWADTSYDAEQLDQFADRR